MLPRIVVVGRKDDALGRALSVRAGEPPFALEFHADGDLLVARLRDECPALVVVGLRGRRGTAVGALIRRIKSWCPQLPIVVACLDESVPGREVLHAARAGAEHFAFRHSDDFPSILRRLVVTEGSDVNARESDDVDDLERARTRAGIRRGERRNRYEERAPAAILALLPASLSPLLRRII